MGNPKIVTIGGGTGAPVVLRALTAAGFKDINAVCAAMDSGGRTGVIRSDERDRVIAISDLLRSLLALIPPNSNKARVDAFREILSYTDGRQRNLGYTIYYTLLEKFEDDFKEVKLLIEQLLGIHFAGQAIPVTLKPTTICFRTKGGIKHRGEHLLDRYSMSKDMIDEIWIEPMVTATREATEVIRQATHIIYCPGSINGSIIVNFLPKGMKRALKQTKAKKILISNLFTTRNETHGFLPENYWRLFTKYTALEQPFDVLITSDLSRSEFETPGSKYHKVARQYAQEHSYFLGWKEAELNWIRDQGVTVIRDAVYSETPELTRLRHDYKVLKKIFEAVVVEGDRQ